MAYVNGNGQVRIGVRRVVTAQQLQTATYLLDSYSGSAAAYSLRKLNSSYSGSAVRVRRSIDNLEQNIGFSGDNLDTTGLLSFVNSSDTTNSKLLDQYSGASAAYSLRKLSATYSGSAIRVRRSSDNQEMNIGFDANGNLDTTTLLSFVGSGNGFVKTWYDQIGSNNFTQISSANQPQIVSSGSVIVDNNKPTISFGTQNNVWYLNSTSSFLSNTPSPICIFSVWKITDWSNSNGGVFGPSNGNSKGLEITQTSTIGRRSLIRINSTPGQTAVTTDIRNNNSADSYQLWNDNQQSLTSINILSTSLSIFKNSSSISLTSTGGVSQINNINDTYSIGLYSGSFPAYMNQQEMVFFTTDKTSQRGGIETNINSYYSIYSQSNNGFVTTWYDQSGNGRHATQTTSSYQPEIVSSGSVLTSIGKPTLRFGNVAGGVTYLENTSLSMNTADVSYVYLANKLSAGTSINAFSIPLALRSNLTNVGIFDWNSLNNIGSRMINDNTVRIYYNSNNIQGSYSYNTNYIIWNQKLGSQLSLSRNGVTQSTTTLAQSSNITSSIISLGGSSIHTSDSNLNGYLTEAILYPSNQTSNKSLIEGNINNYYSIWDSSIVQSGLVMNLDPSFKSSYSGTGSTWTDISYNGSNGTLTNGPSFATASGGQITFDGVNDFVKVPLNLSSYSQITVEIWYKMNPGGSNLSTWGGMLWEHSSDWNSNQGGLGLAVNSGGCSPDLNLMHTNHNGGSGAMNYQYYSGTTWSCHVNIFSRVSDPTGRLAYVNGQLVPFTLTNTCSGVAFSSSTATSASYSPFRNDFLYMASRNGTSGFINTNIGLIRVYSRKLSASEIQQNFNATKSRFGL
jgi:hypothetical protein